MCAAENLPYLAREFDLKTAFRITTDQIAGTHFVLEPDHCIYAALFGTVSEYGQGGCWVQESKEHDQIAQQSDFSCLGR